MPDPDSTNKSPAQLWYDFPKRKMKAEVIDRGIEYMGSCFGAHRTYIPGKDLEDLSFKPCEVKDSACDTEARAMFEHVTQPERKLYGSGNHRRNCVDAYRVWLKVKIPDIGERCAYRFGLDEISTVNGRNNADLVGKVYSSYADSKDAAVWSLAHDKTACVVGFGDLATYVLLASYHKVSEAHTWIGLGLVSTVLSLVLFVCGLCEVASPGAAVRMCGPQE